MAAWVPKLLKKVVKYMISLFLIPITFILAFWTIADCCALSIITYENCNLSISTSTVSSKELYSYS